MKKLSALMLTVIMVLGMCTFAAYADADISIGTYDELTAWAKNGSDDAGKTVVLTADIIANDGSAVEWSSTPPANVWTNKSFAGTFDGQGHTISGLYMAGESKVGFISELSGTVKNLYIVNSAFLGTSSVNAVIARAGGATVENVYSDAIITGTNTCGGIVGQLSGAVTVTGCWFDGSVTLTGSYASGIVGNQESRDAVITDCLNTGTITVSSTGNVAGISTAVYDGKLTATRCVNAGNILTGEDNGGFAICSTVTNRNDVPGEAHVVDCFNLTASSITYPKDIRGDAVFEGEITEFRSFGNLGVFASLSGSWVVRAHNGQKIVVPAYFADAGSTGIPVYQVNEPVIEVFDLKAEGHWGPRWTVTLELPEGFTADNVKLGMLIVPTKAIPAGHELIFEETEYEYRGNTYPVANVEGKIVRETEKGLEATFVITDLSEKTIRCNFTAVPYVIYTVAEGEISLYGASDSTTFYTDVKTCEDAALKAQFDALLAPIDAAIGEGYTVSRDWSTQDVFEEVPAMIVKDTEILPAEDKGATEYTITVDGTEGQIDEYVALLQKFGFKKEYENTLKDEAMHVVNLTKGDLLVTVTDVAYQNKTFVSAMFDQPLSPHLEDNYKDTAIPGAVNTLTQRELYYWGDNYVIQLKNGHFIIVDGATDYELGYLLDYLESVVGEGETPVIEAWCNTHLHYDHFHLLDQFNKHPEWLERVYVEGIYWNEPSNAVKDLDPGVYGQIDAQRLAISKMHTTTGGTPEIYRTMAGQRYYFCDITMDIMLSQELIPLDTYEGGFNESSNWYLFTMDDQTFLEGGDGHRADMKFLMLSYEPEDLQVDFFSVLHHSYNTWDTYTNYVKVFKTILYPTTEAEKEGVLNSDRHKNLNSRGVEYFFAGEATVTFYLPYTPGTLGTNGGSVSHRYIEGRKN